MKRAITITFLAVLALSAAAQNREARTVKYAAKDIVLIKARLGVPSGFLIFARLNNRRSARCHPFFAVSGSPLPLQKK
jgi:hypothetical protein